MKTRRGFTLIEVLMLVLVTAIAMAVSIPVFVSARSAAATKQCRANLQSIANAEEQYKIKVSGHTYTTSLTNLVGDFPVVPVCPNGGTYSVAVSDGTATSQSGQTVPAGKLVVSCSNSNDGKYAPTIDSY